MKRSILALALAAASGLALADIPSGPPTLKFTSMPVMEKVGAGEHKLFPYRSEDKMIVVVVDPIACGQRPGNARFHVEGDKLVLQYDLSPAPDGAARGACTAHSTFELDNMPDRDLQVQFAGGIEPYVVATMTRCASAKPATDVWDCMIPHK